MYGRKPTVWGQRLHTAEARDRAAAEPQPSAPKRFLKAPPPIPPPKKTTKYEIQTADLPINRSVVQGTDLSPQRAGRLPNQLLWSGGRTTKAFGKRNQNQDSYKRDVWLRLDKFLEDPNRGLQTSAFDSAESMLHAEPQENIGRPATNCQPPSVTH